MTEKQIRVQKRKSIENRCNNIKSYLMKNQVFNIKKVEIGAGVPSTSLHKLMKGSRALSYEHLLKMESFLWCYGFEPEFVYYEESQSKKRISSSSNIQNHES